jgi:hypothetical protein
MLPVVLRRGRSEELALDSLTGSTVLEVQLKVSKVLLLELVLLRGLTVSLESEEQPAGPQVQLLKVRVPD